MVTVAGTKTYLNSNYNCFESCPVIFTFTGIYIIYNIDILKYIKMFYFQADSLNNIDLYIISTLTGLPIINKSLMTI